MTTRREKIANLELARARQAERVRNTLDALEQARERQRYFDLVARLVSMREMATKMGDI